MQSAGVLRPGNGVEGVAPPLTYAIGDIHGCFEKLERLWAACLAHAASRACRFVFLGDYVDRGPQSARVVAFLMEAQRREEAEVVCLKGNHEDMLLQAVGGDPRIVAWWIGNGGDATLRSYGVERPDGLPEDHKRWLASLRLSYDDGQRLFVHAGIDPTRPLDGQEEHDLLWIRDPFLSYGGPLPRFVVHGHTPVRTGQPDLRANRLDVDTGAVLGGPLTAAVFDDELAEPLTFLFAH